MRQRTKIGAAALGFAATLIVAGVALADTLPADDPTQSGPQTLIDLGQRNVGEVVTRDVSLTLFCDSTRTSHPAEGTVITLAPSIASRPRDGAINGTPTTVGPVPASWPDPGQPCPGPNDPSLPANGYSTVTLTMPTTPTPGVGFDTFTLMYSRNPSTGLTGSTAISFQVVVVNTPPQLNLPAVVTAEADTALGATSVTWSATATDAEDDPDPTPTCVPASGSPFPLGTTTVNCTVTDGGGLTASGSFQVVVVDTTAPTFVGMPAGLDLTTSDPAGAPLVYTPPTATDVVDPNVVVVCSPPSGEIAPVGPSFVSCTATDAVGNSVTGGFPVNVTLVSTVTFGATWAAPIGGTPPSLVANWGRTVPLKFSLTANGEVVHNGTVTVSFVPCGGGDAVVVIPLAWDGGRWDGHLDTSDLGRLGCYDGTAMVDGNAAGTFRLDVRGAETLKGSATPTSLVTPTGGQGPKDKDKPKK
jgi:hypothetical protein